MRGRAADRMPGGAPAGGVSLPPARTTSGRQGVEKFQGSLVAALGESEPHFLAYFGSFATVGLLWFAHHSLFLHIRRATRPMGLLNTLRWPWGGLPLAYQQTSAFAQQPGRAGERAASAAPSSSWPASSSSGHLDHGPAAGRGTAAALGALRGPRARVHVCQARPVPLRQLAGLRLHLRAEQLQHGHLPPPCRSRCPSPSCCCGSWCAWRWPACGPCGACWGLCARARRRGAAGPKPGPAAPAPC